MAILNFVKPDKIVLQKATEFEAQFEFRPLEPGYGVTIGNSLRRVLLNSLEAYAIIGINIAGAIKLAQASSEAPATLRAQVTSKGGTTFAALQSLEKAGLRPIFTEALRAAADRSRELGDEFAAASRPSIN